MATIYAGGKPMRGLGARQFRAVEFALRYPGWHTFRSDSARVMRSLAARGVIELAGDQFRFCDSRAGSLIYSQRVDALPVQIPCVAWTGGTVPSAYRNTHRREKSLVRVAFREQARDYVDYWHKLPLSAARVFWLRARYDAHASIRAAIR